VSVLAFLDPGIYTVQVSGWSPVEAPTVAYKLRIVLGSSSENPPPLTLGPAPVVGLRLTPLPVPPPPPPPAVILVPPSPPAVPPAPPAVTPSPAVTPPTPPVVTPILTIVNLVPLPANTATVDAPAANRRPLDTPSSLVAA